MTEEPKLFEIIYDAVRQIPRGKVATYGQISQLLGRCSAQMVGFAMAALANTRTNEDVPWQRVINAKGKISPHGFGMGSHMQRELLEEEGIRFDLEGIIPLEEFRWDEGSYKPMKGIEI
jgi:methylated-DNA-protein-cysteine methyltransferase related protein